MPIDVGVLLALGVAFLAMALRRQKAAIFTILWTTAALGCFAATAATLLKHSLS